MICEALLALSLPLFGCEDKEPVRTALPNSDAGALSFTVPPKPEPPAPPPTPAPPPMPTVVVKEVIREVVKEVPAKPTPKPKPKPVSVPVPPKPDPFEVALRIATRVASSLDDRAVVRNGKEIQSAAVNATGGATKGASATPQAAAGLSVPNVPKGKKAQEAATYKAKQRKAGGPLDNSRIFAADRVLVGILETGINTQISSDGGGQVIIQTARDAFGYHGRNILIPKGSRLICDYDSPEDQGASRFALTCNRLLTAGQRVEVFNLKASPTDVQGNLGLSGDVDKRFLERYQTALLLGGISATVQGLASYAQNSAKTKKQNTSATAAQEAAANLSERFGEITASALEQTVDLKPIIRLSQGTRVLIRPAFDWYFPKRGEFPPLKTAIAE